MNHLVLMPIQTSLFNARGTVLLDGPLGRIDYLPAQVSEDCAADWFQVLRESVAWQAERRQMYEREVDVPRLFARFAVDDRLAPHPIRDAARLVSQAVASEFDSVGLNLYRNENDSVAWHNDKLIHLQAGAPIAILSLGATRRMSVRSKTLPRKSLQIDLESGSILLMNYATQLHLDHAIPKARIATGPRISLAFRKRPPAGSHASGTPTPQ